jgi:hypothetical protein
MIKLTVNQTDKNIVVVRHDIISFDKHVIPVLTDLCNVAKNYISSVSDPAENLEYCININGLTEFITTHISGWSDTYRMACLNVISEVFENLSTSVFEPDPFDQNFLRECVIKFVSETFQIEFDLLISFTK